MRKPPKNPKPPEGFVRVPWTNFRWYDPTTRSWRGMNPLPMAVRKEVKP